MTPEERREFDELKDMVRRMDAGFRNPAEIDPQYIRGISSAVKIELNDLTDVDTTGVTNGQVIKYASSTDNWLPADDIDT